MNPAPPIPADETATGEKAGLGIALILAAALIFALSDAVAKFVVGSIPPVELSWLRSIVVIAITLPAVLWRRGFSVLRSRHPVRQCLRGTIVTGSSLFFIFALNYLPLADATAINFIWPVLITVFSAIFLGEKIGIRRIAATLAGFAGMLIIIRPGSSAFQITALLPLGAAVLWATASVMTRAMTLDEPAETTIIWSALSTLVLTTLALPFVWVKPGLVALGCCVIIGVLSATAHAMVIFAFGQTKASSLAPFTYMQLVWATLFGYLIFGAIPDPWIGIGTAIIVASGLYTIHRERVRRLSR
jgi:drug/metabolite transporter (DMT)-like permease